METGREGERERETESERERERLILIGIVGLGDNLTGRIYRKIKVNS
jgi:hypothetical protein